VDYSSSPTFIGEKNKQSKGFIIYELKID